MCRKKKEMKWIKERKRHPDSDTYILVCLNGMVIRTSYYFRDSFGKWFSSPSEIWDKYYTNDVTHWMPLPELPKKGKK